MVIAVTETANKTGDEKKRNSPSTRRKNIPHHQTAHLLMYVHLHTDTHHIQSNGCTNTYTYSFIQICKIYSRVQMPVANLNVQFISAHFNAEKLFICCM